MNPFLHTQRRSTYFSPSLYYNLFIAFFCFRALLFSHSLFPWGYRSAHIKVMFGLLAQTLM